MKTFQDLMAVRANDGHTGKFLLTAVNDFRGSLQYRQACDGMAYYSKHNITMEHYQKFLYTLSGHKIPDIFSANFKLRSSMFRRLVTQEVQYVLGNGMQLKQKEKLGADIDYKLQSVAKMALAQGIAFGYWNYDHLEVFSYADYNGIPGFVPLYDEQTSELRAGIRFWFRDVGQNSVFRATLYEEDGISEWVKEGGSEDVVLMDKKRGYKRTVVKDSTGIIDESEENYSKLPIAVLYGNDTHESELIGIRENLDCYDFTKSGLANQIDDTSGFYWILKNAGGMEDADLAQFVQRMKTVKAAVIDGEEGASAEAHTLEVPYEARKAMLEILRKDIYEDFQMLDATELSAANKTATEIQAAYQAQDNKCADFEYLLIDFVQNICEIAGIPNAEPKFVWNKIINRTEETNMVLSAADYLDEETVLNYLPFVSPDDINDILRKLDDSNMKRMGVMQKKLEQQEQEPEEDDDEMEE